MRKIALAAALLLPLAAFAQQPGTTPAAGAGPGPGTGMGPGMGRGMGPGMGPGMGMGWGPGDPGKRGKLALTLGLAETLELTDEQALKLRGTVDKFHEKRQPLHVQYRDAMDALRKAADADKPDAAAVDQALAKALDAREKMLAADRELIQAVTKDLGPQKKARAALFLSRFHERMAERMGPQGRLGGKAFGPGHGGRGPGRGMGPGPGPCGGQGPCGQGLGPCGGQGPCAQGAGPLGALDDDAADSLALAPAPPPADDADL
jgi:Spy/CpxP family protein refolding chaperone